AGGAGRRGLAGIADGPAGNRQGAAPADRRRPARIAARSAARTRRCRRDAGARRTRPRYPAEHTDPRAPPGLCGAMVRAGADRHRGRAGADLQKEKEDMTDSNPTVPTPAARRNRSALLIVLVLFFGGMLAAGALRFSGWRPHGMKNKGELLQPYGDLRAYAPTLADGRPYAWKDSPRTWRIAAMPRDCDGARRDACT